jgi:hypothetical protein
MSDLTLKTVHETVMMRVISIVAAVFLPGTFISVGVEASTVDNLLTECRR